MLPVMCDVDPIFFLGCRLRVLMRECVKDEDFRRRTQHFPLSSKRNDIDQPRSYLLFQITP